MQPSDQDIKRMSNATVKMWYALTEKGVDVCAVLEKLADKAEKKPLSIKSGLGWIDKI